jgi:ribosomal protein S18 acetylase RimI-like enzyme
MSEGTSGHAPVKGLRLREFVEADDGEVTSWFADAGELRFFAGPRLRWPLDAGQWRSIRMDASVTSWTVVIGEDPTPVGHAEMVRESSAVVRLARLAIAPTIRGRGIGRAVMAQLIDKCREAGYSLVTLAAHPDNSSAIRAYRTLGFELSTQSSSASADRLLLELRLDTPA